MKKTVLTLREKTTQHWFSYFQIVRKSSNKIVYD